MLLPRYPVFCIAKLTMYKFIFTIFLLFSQNSISQSEELFYARGAGTLSCGEYISYVSQKNISALNQVNQFVWGYLVSYQMRGSFNAAYQPITMGNIRIPDGKTIELFLQNYCNSNPLSNLLPALNRLIKESGGIVSN